MLGQSGLFRQNNVEKRRVMGLKEWAELCGKEELRTPPIVDGQVKTRGLQRAPRKQRKTKKGKDREVDPAEELDLADGRDENAGVADYPTPKSMGAHDSPQLQPEQAISGTNGAPNVHEDPFYTEFEPKTAWLPPDTRADDYTPEVCREFERIFWRNCGLGTPPQYGADMAGSLFTDTTTAWNVAKLPSFLSRLCMNKDLPGVNTPYLYFGMWRATFAWHVEDMDLYSINYIHWGAPKYWYAIPSERSKAFEGVMNGQVSSIYYGFRV